MKHVIEQIFACLLKRPETIKFLWSKKKFINKQKQNRSLKLFFSVINAKSVNLLDTSLIPRLSSSTLILATFKSPFEFTVICVTTFFFHFCFNWRNFKRAYFFIRDIRPLKLVSVRVSDPGVMSGTGAGTCVQVMRVVGETADVRGGTGRGRGRRVAFPGGEIFDVVKTGWRFDPFDHLFYSKHPNVSTSEYVLEEFFHRWEINARQLVNVGVRVGVQLLWYWHWSTKGKGLDRHNAKFSN